MCIQAFLLHQNSKLSYIFGSMNFFRSNSNVVVAKMVSLQLNLLFVFQISTNKFEKQSESQKTSFLVLSCIISDPFLSSSSFNSTKIQKWFGTYHTYRTLYGIYHWSQQNNNISKSVILTMFKMTDNQWSHDNWDVEKNQSTLQLIFEINWIPSFTVKRKMPHFASINWTYFSF